MQKQDVVKLNDIKTGRKSEGIEWNEFRFNKQGVAVPLKIWQNLESVLNHYNIKPRLNLIDHEIDYVGLTNCSNTRNGKVLDIHSLQVKAGLNMSKDDVLNGITRIAEKNKYNPFIDMLVENETEEHDIIINLFDKVISLNKSYEEYRQYYETIFIKWCLNVVKMAHNTLEKEYSSQGVLVLQGGQGCYKSTFARNLLPCNKWFKGDKSLNAEDKDSIKQNTKYIIVEWGELDSTLKGEQAKLKQFITSTNDEYRIPYERLEEKFPRVTSYIGTVNKMDFLKDETGSRRFWIIPIQKCNIEEMQKFDMRKFWGAVYNLWKSGEVEDYLTSEEQDHLNRHNKDFNYLTDIAILLNDKIEWDMPVEEWEVYKISEIADELMVRDLKAIKLELEKRGYKSEPHYNKRTQKTKRGFKLPRFKTFH